MALLIPNSIDNDTPADASELQQNFTAIQSHVNTNLIDRNGAVAMTQPLTLAGDPTQPNHAANKDYIDTKTAAIDTKFGEVAAWAPTISGLVKGNGTTLDSVQLKQGRQCTVAWGFKFGTTSTLLTDLRFTLPYVALTDGFNGGGYVTDASLSYKSWPILVQSAAEGCGVWYYGIPAGTARDSCDYYELGAAGWAVNDGIYFELTYLTAT